MAKHKKQRNTAFLFETLILEFSKATMENNKARAKQTLGLIKGFFSSGKELGKELRLFQEILNTNSLDEKTANRILEETKKQHERLNKKQIFNEQTSLIGKIKKILGDGVFNHFVPSYRSMASVAQIFSEKTPIKSKVLLESKVIEGMTASPLNEEKMEPIDNIIYKAFVKRFNEQYGRSLNEEQSKLISKYVMSMNEDLSELNIFLDREIGRLREAVEASLPEQQNEGIKTKLTKLLEKMNGYKKQKPDDKMVLEVLKVQNLVRELV